MHNVKHTRRQSMVLKTQGNTAVGLDVKAVLQTTSLTTQEFREWLVPELWHEPEVCEVHQSKLPENVKPQSVSERMCMCAQSLSRVQLCDPMDWSLSGSSVHEVLQARILEWGAISSSRGSSWLRDQTCVSCIGDSLPLSHQQLLLKGDMVKRGFHTCWKPEEKTKDEREGLRDSPWQRRYEPCTWGGAAAAAVTSLRVIQKIDGHLWLAAWSNMMEAGKNALRGTGEDRHTKGKEVIKRKHDPGLCQGIWG